MTSLEKLALKDSNVGFIAPLFLFYIFGFSWTLFAIILIAAAAMDQEIRDL